jgi:hypothetical protein
LNRTYFSKFYKIEENLLLGNCSRLPFPIEFSSFQQIAAESVNAIEWGIKLIESSSK